MPKVENEGERRGRRWFRVLAGIGLLHITGRVLCHVGAPLLQLTGSTFPRPFGDWLASLVISTVFIVTSVGIPYLIGAVTVRLIARRKPIEGPKKGWVISVIIGLVSPLIAADLLLCVLWISAGELGTAFAYYLFLIPIPVGAMGAGFGFILGAILFAGRKP